MRRFNPVAMRAFALIVTWCIPLLFPNEAWTQTLTNLYSFESIPSASPYTNKDGAGPNSTLVLSNDTLYGTSYTGGNAGNGTVFALQMDGTGFTNLHSFTATFGPESTNGDGVIPSGGLLLAGNTLYGTTQQGGNYGNGTVFALNTDGTGFRNLHSFTATHNLTNSDGANPLCGLVLIGKAVFGTTSQGGKFGNGAIFAVSTDGGAYTNLHNFSALTVVSHGPQSTNSDGARPQGGLALLGNSLFGTASAGGRFGSGAIFAVNFDGSGFTNLYNFTTPNSGPNTNSDGAAPSGVLTMSGNTLFGTASAAGRWNEGTIFKLNADGSDFTTLHSFLGIRTALYPFPIPSADGGSPVGALVVGSNTLYGVAVYGGNTNSVNFGSGTVFSIDTNGAGFTTLYRFGQVSTNAPYTNSDGAHPGGLVLAGGTLYGAASSGGSLGSGTVFSLSATTVSSPQFAAIFADFTTPTIQTAGMTITPTAYFTYNTNFPGSWDIAAQSFGFNGAFDVPASGSYLLTVNHQTSAATTCPGGGYSPVDIYVNGTQIAFNFDPAQQSGGSHSEVTNSWPITASAGGNTLQWAAGALCSRYWIEGIQITPVLAPQLSWTVTPNSVVLYWKTNSPEFILESSTNIDGPWSQVLSLPTSSGFTNFSTNLFTPPTQFYRLKSSAAQ